MNFEENKMDEQANEVRFRLPMHKLLLAHVAERFIRVPKMNKNQSSNFFSNSSK